MFVAKCWRFLYRGDPRFEAVCCAQRSAFSDCPGGSTSFQVLGSNLFLITFPFQSHKKYKATTPLKSLMVNQPLEQPLYRVYQSKPRALIPKTVFLFFLASIFYLAVLLNISLLELNAEEETMLKTGALVILTVLIIIGIATTFRKTWQPYLFYRNKIVQGKETLDYSNITNTAPHTNFLDKTFKTYSIQLSKNFSIRHIPEQIQLSNYIQQLVSYAKNQGYD